MTKEQFIKSQVSIRIHPMIFAGLSDNITIDPKSPIKVKDAHRVLTVVCKHFNVSIEDVKGVTRKRELVIPRQICMYILAVHSELSLKRIGLIFNRDHSTALYGRDTVIDLMDTDKRHKRQVTDCIAAICMSLPYLYYTPKSDDNGN